MVMKVTRETKAVMSCSAGRVVAFVKDSEPGKLSLAVPNDRAVMTPREARELAAWLNETAAEVERERAASARSGMTARSDAQYRTAEREWQRELMTRGLR